MSKILRNLLYILALFCCALTASAQSSSSLVIDASSLEPVNSDPITGLAIDPIGLDRSNRPCARIKLHINRMTAEDISSLEVRPIGGNPLVMKSQVAYEGNGLIIEITAKPQTRFYLHHARLGDSRPVTLNLEPNKEYRLEAWNEQMLPITVFCEKPGAEVYLDDSFKGYITSNNHLTIASVSEGTHILRVESRSGQDIRQIEVSPESVFFNLEVDALTQPVTETDSASESSSTDLPETDSVPDADSALQNDLTSEADSDTDSDTNVEAKPEAEVASKPVKQRKPKKIAEPVEGKFLTMASVGLYPQMTYGLQVGYMKKFGGYLKFRSNFNFSTGSYSCTSDGYAESGNPLYTSGSAPRYSRTLATGGVLFSLSKNIYPYVGTGYGVRSVLWEDSDGKWAQVSDYKYKGVSAEAGVAFRFGSFSFSLGASTIAFKTSDFELGIGLMF